MSLPLQQHRLHHDLADPTPSNSHAKTKTEEVVALLKVYKEGEMVDSLRLQGGDDSVFVLGRHANCTLLLTHPSISRHHLEIRLLPSTRRFLLIDLDSVHGTWLDGKQLPSLTPVTASEGEAIRLGSSSRTYKLQWLNTASSQKTESCNYDSQKSAIMINNSIMNDSCHNDEAAAIYQDKLRLSAIRGARGEIDSTIGNGSRSAMDENVDSEQNLQNQPPRKPLMPSATRRVPFAPLQANTNSPTVAKSSKHSGAEKKVPISTHSQKQQVTIADENQVSVCNHQTIRRCNSAPPPLANWGFPSQIVSNEGRINKSPAKDSPSIKQSPLSSNLPKARIHTQTGFSRAVKLCEGKGGVRSNHVEDDKRNRSSPADCRSIVRLISLSEVEDEDEEYPSDKENQEPVSEHGKVPSAGELLPYRALQRYGNANNSLVNRIPFQPLPLLTSASVPNRSSSPSESYTPSEEEGDVCRRTNSRSSSVIQNLDCILEKLRGLSGSEHKWHLVVDSTCLMDPASFKCLKLLEGLAEVRLIIPQIVIRELDVCTRKNRASVPPHVVLKWIEFCMLKFPSWIHVQSSSETLAANTPPPSPHRISMHSPRCFGDLMSPTNGDHILNCALLFSSTLCEGQIALLTVDTALKIKAMAEGVICESAVAFCESLLSPYSERFLWMGSVAHRSQGLEKLHRVVATDSSVRIQSSNLSEPGPSSERCGLGGNTKHQVVQRLKKHCWEARGLKAILI